MFLVWAILQERSLCLFCLDLHIHFVGCELPLPYLCYLWCILNFMHICLFWLKLFLNNILVPGFHPVIFFWLGHKSKKKHVQILLLVIVVVFMLCFILLICGLWSIILFIDILSYLYLGTGKWKEENYYKTCQVSVISKQISTFRTILFVHN